MPQMSPMMWVFFPLLMFVFLVGMVVLLMVSSEVMLNEKVSKKFVGHIKW